MALPSKSKRYDLTDDKGNYVAGKSCYVCGVIFPDTFEFFYKRKSKNGVVTRNMCKNCDKKLAKEYKQRTTF